MPNTELNILTCLAAGKAVKEFFAKTDGTIEKRSYSAGTFFKHEAKPVTCFSDMVAILEELLDQPNKFIIRGVAKPSAGAIVRRKINEPGAAFDACHCSWIMLDFDKYPCPEHFDLVKNPEEAIEWLIATLYSAFLNASCYWQLSSSQNVPTKVGEKPQSTISVHLYFYFDRNISDKELKCFFKANPAKVDLALFSAVQIHYTSRPIFHGMSDPLPIRSGIIKRDSDVVVLPEIIVPEEKAPKPRLEHEPVVTLENWSKAIELFLTYYKEGIRDKMCGAIAATLYRRGWTAANASTFVYELADAAGDEEANNRYDSALRACDSVDNNRPVPGIPVLRDELGIVNIDEILLLLGVGKPDIKAAISSLVGCNDMDKLRGVICMLISIPQAEQETYLDQIKAVTKYSKKTLNEFLKEAKENNDFKPPVDWSDITMERFLHGEFEGGRLLLRSKNSQYWSYNGKYWELVPEDFIKNKLLNYARDASGDSGGDITANSVVHGVLNLLSGRVYRESNPLHSKNMPSVINCLNGELWLDANADISLRPHLPESYLQHCLEVNYNPSAESPLFDKAVLEIFANSTNPEDMARHFMEFAGYVCQPWRKLAAFILLYGYGKNGKSSLMTIIENILGEKMIMADRIGNVERKDFKIGALDGKLMFLDDDVAQGTVLPDGFLKKISEEKLLTGDQKHKSHFQFICRALPVMLSNTYPALRDLSDGMRRRMMVIPFARRFEKATLGLFDQIWEKEAQGILNQFIAGFQRVKRRGGFQEPKDCIVAKQEWISKSNIVPAFIHDCCEEGRGFSQSLGELYKAFEIYCEGDNTSSTLPRSWFAQKLESLGFSVVEPEPKGKKKKVVYGLKTIENADSNMRKGGVFL